MARTPPSSALQRNIFFALPFLAVALVSLRYSVRTRHYHVQNKFFALISHQGHRASTSRIMLSQRPQCQGRMSFRLWQTKNRGLPTGAGPDRPE